MATKTATPSKESNFTLNKGQITFHLVGQTPLIMNRLSSKVKMELLHPTSRKRKADRVGVHKHYPMNEYRDSIHRAAVAQDGQPICYMPSACMKGAIASAALDYPGVTKSAIARCVYVEGENFPIWGIPHFYMSPVRSADMNKTPDIRTRAIFPQWAAEITVTYLDPMVEARVINELMQVAGWTNGLGDFRQQKGKGNYGCWMIVDKDDPQLLALKQVTAADQIAAIEAPEFYDADSKELYEWWCEKTASGELPHEDAKAAVAPKKVNGSAEVQQVIQ